MDLPSPCFSPVIAPCYCSSKLQGQALTRMFSISLPPVVLCSNLLLMSAIPVACGRICGPCKACLMGPQTVLRRTTTCSEIDIPACLLRIYTRLFCFCRRGPTSVSRARHLCRGPGICVSGHWYFSAGIYITMANRELPTPSHRATILNDKEVVDNTRAHINIKPWRPTGVGVSLKGKVAQRASWLGPGISDLGS